MKGCPPRLSAWVIAALIAVVALLVAGGACRVQDGPACVARHSAW